VLAVSLVALRLALPHLVKNYVNRTLSEIPGYRGRVGDIDIALWRGAYTIHRLDLVKTDGKVPVPFFSTTKADLSVQWRELFHGALVGEIELAKPKLNFVQAPTPEQSQTEIDSRWQDQVKKLFPVKINRFHGRKGEIHFRNFHTDPKVDVTMDDVEIEATNLANSRRVAKTLRSHMEMRGRPFHGARLVTIADIDPFAEQPTFNLDLKLTEVNLVELNDFLQAYGRFDVKQGTSEFYSEMAASDGAFRGYVKLLITDLDVVELKEDVKNPLVLAWKGVVSGVYHLFRNQRTGKFATRVPFTGRFEDPQAAIWPTIGNVFWNAFIKALPPKLENSIDLGAAREEERKEAGEEKRQ
jgi:uncharacterized protein DUF748